MLRRNTFEKNCRFRLFQLLIIFSWLWIFPYFFLFNTAYAGGSPPVAVDDSYTIDEGGLLNPAAPALLANDTDAA